MTNVEQAKKNVVSSFLVIILIAVFTIIVLTIMNNYFIPKQYYKASDFKIKTIYVYGVLHDVLI